MIFQSQENQDNADGVKNTVNGWVQQMIGDRLSCTALTFLTPHILL
jgi:hypothetical protein